MTYGQAKKEWVDKEHLDASRGLSGVSLQETTGWDNDESDDEESTENEEFE